MGSGKMRKKMMLVPLLFLIFMVIPMVDAREGNETVVDNPDVVIILPPPPPPPPFPITNETDPVIIVTDSIQMQLDNIYNAMIMQDTLIMNGRSSVRKLNATLNDAIVDFGGIVEDLVIKLLDSDAQLQGQIDTQNTYIEELRQEVSQLQQELLNERAMRNNITIMFGVFCLVVIGAIVVINKK
jgi:hypothetical protein